MGQDSQLDLKSHMPITKNTHLITLNCVLLQMHKTYVTLNIPSLPVLLIYIIKCNITLTVPAGAGSKVKALF